MSLYFGSIVSLHNEEVSNTIITGKSCTPPSDIALRAYSNKTEKILWQHICFRSFMPVDALLGLIYSKRILILQGQRLGRYAVNDPLSALFFFIFETIPD